MTTEYGTATLLKDRLPNFSGHAQLWQLDPPLLGYDKVTSHEYVVVSGVNAMFSGPETYVFPADADGKVIHWGELDGSFRGEINHEKALRNAGYSTLVYETTVE